MAKPNDAWTVLSHGAIEKLADNLWRVEGAVPHMSLRRCMTVARMRDGRLVVHSAMALDEPSMRDLEAWGTPAFLLVPNGYHRLDAPAYKRRYPQLRVLAPRGSRAKVAQKVAVDGTYDDFPSDPDVRLEMLRGVRDAEGVMIVRSADGVTLVLNDVVFNMPEKPRDPLGWLMTTVMGSAPGPRVSRLVKLALAKDPKALRDGLERLAATPDLARVIVAHGAVATGGDASRALRTAATYLK